MIDREKALELLNEFGSVVNSIYGVYLDSTRGFNLVRKQHIEEEQQFLQKLKISQPELANIEYLDKRSMYYGKGDPNKPESEMLQVSTQAEFKARNEKGGANHKFIANMCLVSIYQYWEDEYRGKIEQALGLEENSVQSDIMGDIRWLRQSIIHNKAIASKKVRKCKALKWFKKGAEVSIDEDMFQEMVSQIYKFIENFPEKFPQKYCTTHSLKRLKPCCCKIWCWLKKNKVPSGLLVTILGVSLAFYLVGWDERKTLDTATKQKLHLVVLEASYNSTKAKDIYGDYAKFTDPNTIRINFKRLDSVAATEAFQDTHVLALLSRFQASLLKSYMDRIGDLNRVLQIHQGILESTGYKTSETEKGFRPNICNRAAETYAKAIVLQEELDKYCDRMLYSRKDKKRMEERITTIKEKALKGEWLTIQRGKNP